MSQISSFSSIDYYPARYTGIREDISLEHTKHAAAISAIDYAHLSANCHSGKSRRMQRLPNLLVDERVTPNDDIQRQDVLT